MAYFYIAAKCNILLWNVHLSHFYEFDITSFLQDEQLAKTLRLKLCLLNKIRSCVVAHIFAISSTQLWTSIYTIMCGLYVFQNKCCLLASLFSTTSYTGDWFATCIWNGLPNQFHSPQADWRQATTKGQRRGGGALIIYSMRNFSCSGLHAFHTLICSYHYIHKNCGMVWF